ncbi:hypothetical protein ACX80U_12185 [Arthrobacter sp. TmT3-37]
MDWLHPRGQHEDEYKGRKWADGGETNLPASSVTPGPVYATDVRGAGYIEAPSDEWTLEAWHQDAIADARSSHKLVGRAYVVQCEWCPAVFIAHTKAKAMELFEAHEQLMLNPEGSDQ